jgi:hypothetical protein
LAGQISAPGLYIDVELQQSRIAQAQSDVSLQPAIMSIYGGYATET